MLMTHMESDKPACFDLFHTKKFEVFTAIVSMAFMAVAVYLTTIPFIHADSTINQRVVIGYACWSVGVLGICGWAKITPYHKRTVYHRITIGIMSVLSVIGMMTLMWFVYGMPFSQLG